MSEQLEIVVKYKGRTIQQWAHCADDLAKVARERLDTINKLQKATQDGTPRDGVKIAAMLTALDENGIHVQCTPDGGYTISNAWEMNMADVQLENAEYKRELDRVGPLLKKADAQIARLLQANKELHKQLNSRATEVERLNRVLRNVPAQHDVIAVVRAVLKGFLPEGSPLVDEAADRIKEIVYGAPPLPYDDDETALATEPVGPKEAKRTRQYYYRNAKCDAVTSDSAKCLCWHDEGTGPLPQAREGVDVHGVMLKWRNKTFAKPKN